MFHPHFWWLNLSSWPIFHSPHKLSSIAGWLVMFMLCSFQIAKTQRWVSTHPGSPVSWGWNLKEIPIFHGLLNGLLVRITQQIWVYNLQQMFLKILERWYSKSPRTWIQNPDIFLPGEHHLKKHVEEIDVQNLQVYQFYTNTGDICQPFWWNPELDPSLSLSQPTIGPPCLAGHRRPHRSGNWTNGDFMGFMADLW